MQYGKEEIHIRELMKQLRTYGEIKSKKYTCLCNFKLKLPQLSE